MTQRLTNRQKRTFGNVDRRGIREKQAACKCNGERRIRPDGCLVCKYCQRVLHDPRALPLDEEN